MHERVKPLLNGSVLQDPDSADTARVRNARHISHLGIERFLVSKVVVDRRDIAPARWQISRTEAALTRARQNSPRLPAELRVAAWETSTRTSVHGS